MNTARRLPAAAEVDSGRSLGRTRRRRGALGPAIVWLLLVAPADAANDVRRPAPPAGLAAAPTAGTTAPDPVGIPPATSRPAAPATPVAEPSPRAPSSLPDLAAADRLFREVDDTLWDAHRRARAAIASDAPDVLARHEVVVGLFAQRDRLFALVTARTRERLESGGPVGRASFWHELAYLKTRLLSQVRVVRQGTRQVASNVGDSPLVTIWRALQLALVVVVFRGWRRWSRKGLKASRQRLLAIRPRQASNLRLARLLWYVDRVGGPLAWLILVVVLEQLVSPRGFEEITSLIYTILVWVFVARLIVQLIDALAARGVAGLRSARADLRLGSLRLIAGWAVVLGLGSSLVTRYLGHGTVHAYWVRLWTLMSVPVAALLVYWWRDEIHGRLEALSHELAWARRLAERRRGLWGYLLTILGAVYLLWVEAIDRLLALLSGWDIGRRFIAVLVRREVERDSLRGDDQDESPIPDALAERLIEARDVRLDAVAKSERTALLAAVAEGRGGGHVVLGERGLGKTVFLERLAAEIGEGVISVGCPPGGYPALARELAGALGVSLDGDPADEAATRRLAAAIDAAGVRVILVDDAHLLARPWMGGQRGLDRLVGLDGAIHTPIDWVLAIDDRAWRYISLARGERALFHGVVPLPAWSEESLGMLLQSRAKSCGLELDYGRIVLPRQLDAGEHDSAADRNRFGYARILWELADGNPEVAMRLFAGSLRRTQDGRIVVRLPQATFSVALNEASIETLLALRVMMQCEIATTDDLVRSLRISEARAVSIVRFCLQNGWIEPVEGGHRIEWSWFRPIARALVRRNLMAR